MSAPEGDTLGVSLRERARAREGRAELLLFRVGGERFAVELAAVDEALDLAGIAVHPVPGRHAGALGVVALRGALVPLYAAAAGLGVASGGRETALVFRRGGARVALLVDDAEDVLSADLALLRPPPHGAGERDGLLLGVLQHGSDLVGVLDAEALLAACRAETSLETP